MEAIRQRPCHTELLTGLLGDGQLGLGTVGNCMQSLPCAPSTQAASRQRFSLEDSCSLCPTRRRGPVAVILRLPSSKKTLALLPSLLKRLGCWIPEIRSFTRWLTL